MSELLLPVYGLRRLRMSIDGVGVTTLVGVYGCHLRCLYCINAQMRVCPVDCQRMTVDELYEETKIDNLYFLSTGGGLTFGGGESLLQADFVADFHKKYHDLGWNITFETSLNVPRRYVERSMECADFYIVDIKSMNQDIYYRYTKQPLKQAVSNLEMLLQSFDTQKIKVRVPLIPDINTTEDTQQSVERLQQMGVTNIELFNYVKPDEYRLAKTRRNQSGRTERDKD